MEGGRGGERVRAVMLKVLLVLMIRCTRSAIPRFSSKRRAEIKTLITIIVCYNVLEVCRRAQRRSTSTTLTQSSFLITPSFT